MVLAPGLALSVLAACQVFATTALADGESWNCAVASRCVTGESCFDLATPAWFTLDLTADGKAATLKSPGETATMQLIDAQSLSRTFFHRMGSETIGFMTLYSGGGLMLSSHDASGGNLVATASNGTCKRVDN